MNLLTKEMLIHYGTINIVNSNDGKNSEATMIVAVSGENLNQDIEDYLRRFHNIRIDSPIAEKVRISVGSALAELKDAPEEMTVEGHNKITNLPQQVTIGYQEISCSFRRTLEYIEKEIEQTLNSVHSKIYDDIVKNGICLTGSGASLRGLAERFEAKTNIHCYVS